MYQTSILTYHPDLSHSALVGNYINCGICFRRIRNTTWGRGRRRRNRPSGRRRGASPGPRRRRALRGRSGRPTSWMPRGGRAAPCARPSGSSCPRPRGRPRRLRPHLPSSAPPSAARCLKKVAMPAYGMSS